ncbi:MAG TPA: hypothetical protein VGR01_12195 [Burkholderiales bacterium]|jgi:hypothetical protein|nr:hypothetical protein [Burkholderiales bacterium]
MIVDTRLVAAALLTLAMALPAAANPETATDKSDQIAELIDLHDLKTSVSIGNYYLKQESLLAIRALLARLGREQNLGPEWDPGNPHWRRAEGQLLGPVMAGIAEEWASLDWLRPQWQELDNREFSSEELDVLLTHLRSDVGRKQVKIMDHTVSTHVMMALSFSGKLKDIAGAETDRTRMQELWNAEDAEMRFSIQDATNVEGQRFALSPLGKKYFVTAILKLTGIVNRRIDELAGMLPRQVDTHADQVRPLLEEFKSGRG